jgi:hypothetical protein
MSTMTPQVAAAGESALKKFRSSIQPLGLFGVVERAFAAEAAIGMPELQAREAQARKERDAAAPGTPERIAKERALFDVTRDVAYVEPHAAEVSRRVWEDPKSARAILADLRAVAVDIRKEMGRVITEAGRYLANQGLSSSDDELCRAFAPAYPSLSDFLERHVESAIERVANRIEQGQADPKLLQECSWVLAGCGWRQVKLPEKRSLKQQLGSLIP